MVIGLPLFVVPGPLLHSSRHLPLLPVTTTTTITNRYGTTRVSAAAAKGLLALGIFFLSSHYIPKPEATLQ